MTSDNCSQVKSLFLATVMVLSVIAIGAAGFAGSAAAQTSNSDLIINSNSDANQNVTAGGGSQEITRVIVEDDAAGLPVFGGGSTQFELPDGITVSEGESLNAFSGGSGGGDLSVTGVEVSNDRSTITVNHEGQSVDDDTIGINAFNVDVATDIDATNDPGTNADITVVHNVGETDAQFFNVHKPEINISSANTPEIGLGTTDKTLEDATGGADNFDINTTNVTGQIGSGTTVTVTVGDGITWNATNSSLPASNVVNNDSSALNVDTDNIDVTADAISIPVLSEANASSSPPQIALNNSGIAVDIAGDAPIDTNVSINATVNPTNSLGTVDVVSNAEINVTAPQTRLEAPSNTTSVQKTQQPIGNVSVHLGSGEVGATENVTISLNNSDVTFDSSSSAAVNVSNDADNSPEDVVFQNSNSEISTQFNDSGGSASTGNEVVTFYDLRINVSEGTTAGSVGFDASFASDSNAPTLTISDNNNVTEYKEASADFDDSSDQTVFVDNDGISDVGVNNITIDNSSIDQDITAIDSSENATVDLSNTNGIVFNASNMSLNNGSLNDVTVSENQLDINASFDNNFTLGEDGVDKSIRLDVDSDAEATNLPTATVYTGDFNYTTDFSSRINVSTAEVDNVNAPVDNSTEVDTEITEEVEVTSSELNQDGVTNEFGGADVELSLQSSPDAFDGSITDLVNSASITTESDGNASYTFSSGVTGEYVIDHNASESANETTTYTVNSGEIDSIAVEGVENAFRGVPNSADANERNAVYKVEVLDANGNPATVDTDFEFQVVVDDGSSTSNLTALSDELPSSGQPLADANASVEEDGTADGPFTSVDGNVFQYNPGKEDASETNSQGIFYIYASSNVAGDIEVDVLPTNFASDSGTATFFEAVDTVSLDAPSSLSVDENVNVTATAQTSDGTTIEVPRLSSTFSSDNGTVVTVEDSINTDTSGVATGNITADAAGVSNLTATVNPANADSTDSESQSITVTNDTTVDTGSLTFNDQALAADNTVTVEDVSTGQPSTVVVTYLSDNENVVAGTATADNLAGENVSVEIQDTGGFPGDHTAHVFNTSDVSDVSIGDDATPVVDAALDTQTANITVQEDAPAYYTLKLSNSTADRGVQAATINTFATHRQSGSTALLPRSVYRYTRTHTGGLR